MRVGKKSTDERVDTLTQQPEDQLTIAAAQQLLLLLCCARVTVVTWRHIWPGLKKSREGRRSALE